MEAAEPSGLLAFDVRTDRGAVWLTLQGEIDLSVTSLLSSAFDEAVSQATTLLVADLGDVQYIDSSGLKVLVNARQTCDGAGVRFQIVNLTPLVKTVFEIAGLLDALCPGEAVDIPADV